MRPFLGYTTTGTRSRFNEIQRGRSRADSGTFAPAGQYSPLERSNVLLSSRTTIARESCSRPQPRVTCVGMAFDRATGLDRPEVDPAWVVPPMDADSTDAWASHFLDLERDATVADLREALEAGLTSIEHLKRYTTIGTGSDQGKTSGVVTSAIAASL